MFDLFIVWTRVYVCDCKWLCANYNLAYKIWRTRVSHISTIYLNDFLFYFIGQFILWCKVVLVVCEWVNARWLMLMMLLPYTESNEPHAWYTIPYFGWIECVLRAYKRFTDVYINMFECITVVILMCLALAKIIWGGQCIVCMHDGSLWL